MSHDDANVVNDSASIRRENVVPKIATEAVEFNVSLDTV